MDTPRLILDSIIIRFGQKKVLNGVYLTIEPGKIYGIYGLNGAGKSTLMKIVTGLLQPDSGTVFISGTAYATPRIRERFFHTGYLPQQGFLPDDCKVCRLVNQFPSAAQSILSEVPFSALANKRVGTLSNGERRYLEIRLVLSLGRQFVLLDEPFTGLEPILIERVINDIQISKKRGAGILLTDHYHQYVSSTIDEAYILNEGRCSALESDRETTKQWL